MTRYISLEKLMDAIETMPWFRVNKNGEIVEGATTDEAIYKAKDIIELIQDFPVEFVKE